MNDPNCYDCQHTTGGCGKHGAKLVPPSSIPQLPNLQLIAAPTQWPFRCPLCGGSGRLHDPIAGSFGGHECHGCKGSGIIWGPPK